jgi:hypothetical protein
MSMLTELIVRGILVIALNDGIILYVMKRRGQPITCPLIAAIILVTCVAFVLNTWFCLHKWGVV